MIRGATPFAVLGLAALLFGVSMTTPGSGLVPALGAARAVQVFSMVEMAFGPMVSAAYAGLPIDSS